MDGRACLILIVIIWQASERLYFKLFDIEDKHYAWRTAYPDSVYLAGMKLLI